MASLSLLSARVQASPRQRRGASRLLTEGLGDTLEGDFSKAGDKKEANKEKAERRKIKKKPHQ